MKNFKDVEWLKENIGNEDLVVLDIRAEMGEENKGRELFLEGHILNSLFVPLEERLTDTVKKHGGRHPMPNIKVLEEYFRELGINETSTVLIYDQGDLPMAGRLWWMLRRLGHEQSYVLKGGIEAWKAMGYPLEKGEAKYKEKGSFNAKDIDSIEASIEDVYKAQNNDSIVIVDSRDTSRYLGKEEPIDKIAGHIPWAINYPWTEAIADSKAYDLVWAKEHFKDLFDKEDIIVHCGSGITATVNMLFMEEIGLSPKLYVGSYSDWVSYDENEIIQNDVLRKVKE